LQIVQEFNNGLSQLIARKRVLIKKENDKHLSFANNANIRLDDYLLENNYLTEEQIVDLGVIFFGYKNFNIDKIEKNNDLISEVNEDFFNDNYILPISKYYSQGELTYIVAVTDPFDLNLRDIVFGLYGHNATIIYTTKGKLRSIFSVVHSKQKIEQAIIDVSIKEEDLPPAYDIEDTLSSSPAVVIVENILREAIALKASDIHIEPYETFVRVRNRIDGVLYESSKFDIQSFQPIVTRLKIIGGLNITEKRIPQDGRFSLRINDVDYDFRLSTLPTVNGEKAVIRILDTSAFSFNLKELGFNQRNIDLVKPILRHPHGIILLTGPTGCGKSTTLYSFIREVNSVASNIVSVEDPVEYTIDGINQVQVNTKVDMTFAKALRSILRQDPNIIMIGEIRDEETAHIAIRASITGHLVFSTLHTNDAVGAVIRLVDMGVEPYLVSDALDMVIAQRLIRKLCPECRKKTVTNPFQMQVLGLKEPMTIYRPNGCPACHNTGYRGRTGIHEVLILDDTIRSMIANRQSSEQISKYLYQSGNFIDLKHALIEAIKNGITDFNEIYNVSDIDE